MTEGAAAEGTSSASCTSAWAEATPSHMNLEVAASGAAQHQSLVANNPALEGLKSYVRSACESKIYPAHFSRAVNASKQ